MLRQHLRPLQGNTMWYHQNASPSRSWWLPSELLQSCSTSSGKCTARLSFLPSFAASPPVDCTIFRRKSVKLSTPLIVPLGLRTGLSITVNAKMKSTIAVLTALVFTIFAVPLQSLNAHLVTRVCEGGTLAVSKKLIPNIVCMQETSRQLHNI